MHVTWMGLWVEGGGSPEWSLKQDDNANNLPAVVNKPWYFTSGHEPSMLQKALDSTISEDQDGKRLNQTKVGSHTACYLT